LENNSLDLNNNQLNYYIITKVFSEMINEHYIIDYI